MNPHNVIGDSDESAIVDPEIIANPAGSSSSAAAAAEDTLAAQVMPRQDRSDESDKWLMIEHVASDTGQARPSKTLDEVIKQTLIRLLGETRGNRRRTASLIGISRSTLYRMLERYDIGHVGRDPAKSRKSRVDRTVPPVPTE
jgi:DNA-binding NtrC family response regulator